jgi:hypothetical protein
MVSRLMSFKSWMSDIAFKTFIPTTTMSLMLQKEMKKLKVPENQRYEF